MLSAVINHRLPGAPILEHLKYSVDVSEVLCDQEINMVARDGNFYFRKTSLSTGFSACNCLFDSRNCLLTSLILGSYYSVQVYFKTFDNKLVFYKEPPRWLAAMDKSN